MILRMDELKQSTTVSKCRERILPFSSTQNLPLKFSWKYSAAISSDCWLVRANDTKSFSSMYLKCAFQLSLGSWKIVDFCFIGGIYFWIGGGTNFISFFFNFDSSINFFRLFANSILFLFDVGDAWIKHCGNWEKKTVFFLIREDIYIFF